MSIKQLNLLEPMKFFLQYIVFAIAAFNLAAQNLVPNPSFEDTIECPTSVTQIFKAENWLTFGASPDYYHGCDNIINGVVGVPNNWICYQNAHSGYAYSGIIPYDLTGAPYREFIAVKLIETTEVDKQYFITFYVSFAGTLGFTIATNKLGVALTNVLYSESYPFPITNNPVAYDESIYSDTLGWSKISLSFIADSAYEYLVIGNFFDDQNTDTLQLGEFNSHSYYLIDDVCLSKNESTCNKNTSVTDLDSQASILITPNPVTDILHLKTEDIIGTIRIWDILGRVIFSTNNYTTNMININCSLWVNGPYIITINSTFQKFIIEH